MENLYQLIEEKRKEKKMSISKVCREVGIVDQTYLNMKSGKSMPGTKTFFKICVIVGINDLENLKQYVL
jgi:DNA-binding XRE family transcriptional regulator